MDSDDKAMYAAGCLVLVAIAVALTVNIAVIVTGVKFAIKYVF